MRMDRQKILHLLNDILELSEEISFSEDTLLKDIGLDSLKFISFIVKLEEEFSIEIHDSDLLLENFETIGKIFETLSKYFDNTPIVKKYLILDCDNVLWKGISGEEPILIDEEVKAFQSALLELEKHGILLCLCSKNEQELIEKSLLSPEMLIKPENILIRKVGRDSKVQYLTEIAKELNLSTDSFVFADDSDYEIGFVTAVLPKVMCIKVDYDNLCFVQKINEAFSGTPQTEIERTKQYREQKDREKEKVHSVSVEEYNCSLNTVAICREASAEDISRLSELSQRTNQFNLSDKHYTVEELTKIQNHPDCVIYVLSVTDKYGDMGIVGMAVLRGNLIEAFMLSCRAFDRGLEFILLNRLKEQSEELMGVYCPNEKNHRYANFYIQNGVRSV